MLPFTIAKHFASGRMGDNMVGQQLDNFLSGEGYAKIPSNLPEFTIYFHPENNYMNVFHVINYRNDLYVSADQYEHIKEKIKALFAEKGAADVHILSLIICADIGKAKQLCREDPFCWIIDTYNNRLMIYENQVDDFYGMKDKLEYFLAHMPPKDSEQTSETISSASGKKFKLSGLKLPYLTSLLVFINIIVFVICTFTGDLLYNVGAFSAGEFVERKEYYRIFTSIFLHWDINHLVSNMIVLFYLGEVVEKHFGSVRYGIIYFVTGICGNLLSMGYELYTNAYVSSVGASGAVFGIIGALLILVIIHKGRLDQITIGRLLFMIFYSLYSGFAGSNINNAAHLGGFLSGMAVACILYHKSPRASL